MTRIDIRHGDCREVIKTLADCSVDSVVTDPPYSLVSIQKRFGKPGSAPVKVKKLDGQGGSPYARAARGFMGKQWDTGEVAFDPEFWVEVWRVLKPGAFLLAMGGDRTFHRLACAIEDAGFEIRGTTAWIFGSGFPKNYNVSKKLAGSLPADALRACDLCDWQIAQGSLSGCASYRGCDDEQSQSEEDTGLNAPPSLNDAREHTHADPREDARGEAPSSICLDEETARRANGGSSPARQPPQADFRDLDSIPSDTALSTLPVELTVGHKNPRHKSGTQHSGGGLASETWYANLPQCPRCGKNGIPQGLGTSLKPAMELICMARKPLISTVAENVLEHGTGALNIAACRVAAADDDLPLKWETPRGGIWRTDVQAQAQAQAQPAGRFPANVIHDGSEEVLEAFAAYGNAPGQQRSVGPEHGEKASVNVYGDYGARDHFEPRGDLGSAARFFYSAKADADDRTTALHDEVTITWILGQERHQVRLQVDTAPSQPRVTGVFPSGAASEWNTFLFGNGIADLFRAVIKSTIATTTNSTTGSRTWNSLMRSLTSACMADASLLTGNGGSRAARAEKPSWKLRFIAAEMASLPSANNVPSGALFEISIVEKQTTSHPTVKPVDLMAYLCRLITPPGGLVLDPFAGSGSTGMACLREGFHCILIEREDEYVKDIHRRVAHVHGDDAPLFMGAAGA